MRQRRYIFAVLILVLLAGAIAPRSRAESELSQEYKVKAAFLYNFIKFVDWPNGKAADANQPITIGIIGKDPFGKAFEPVKDKPVKGKKVTIKRLKSITELKKLGEAGKDEIDKQIEAAKKCHLLFICASEKESLEDIIKAVRDRPVLTVADTAEFLKSGGIINFVMEEQKVRFEVNSVVAKRAKLQIRSQLLRLAKKVISQERDSE